MAMFGVCAYGRTWLIHAELSRFIVLTPTIAAFREDGRDGLHHYAAA